MNEKAPDLRLESAGHELLSKKSALYSSVCEYFLKVDSRCPVELVAWIEGQ